MDCSSVPRLECCGAGRGARWQIIEDTHVKVGAVETLLGRKENVRVVFVVLLVVTEETIQRVHERIVERIVASKECSEEIERIRRMEVGRPVEVIRRSPHSSTSRPEKGKYFLTLRQKCDVISPAVAPGTVSVPVKSRSLVGITEDFISLCDLFEPLLGPGLLILVRVILQGELPVGLLDLVLTGVSLNAERVVVILTHLLSALTTQLGFKFSKCLLALHESVCFPFIS